MTKYCHGVTLRCWWALWSCEKFHWCDCRTNNSDHVETCLLQSNTSWDFLLIWFWLIWESSIAVMNLQRIITTICSFPQIHSFSFISPSSSSNSTVLTHTQHLQLWFHLQPAANFSKKVLNFLCTLPSQHQKSNRCSYHQRLNIVEHLAAQQTETSLRRKSRDQQQSWMRAHVGLLFTTRPETRLLTWIIMLLSNCRMCWQVQINIKVMMEVNRRFCSESFPPVSSWELIPDPYCCSLFPRVPVEGMICCEFHPVNSSFIHSDTKSHLEVVHYSFSAVRVAEQRRADNWELKDSLRHNTRPVVEDSLF